MKKLIILMMPALMLIGCGEMSSTKTTANDLSSEMAGQGNLSAEDQQALQNLNDPSLLNESLTVTENSSDSLLMQLGGADLLIDFINNLNPNDENATAMIINGVEVSQKVAKDPTSFQGLLASLIASQLGGIDIMGIDISELIGVGMDLLTGKAQLSDLSSVFGVLIRGALNMFMSSIPFGNVLAPLVGTIIDNVVGGDSSSGNTSTDNGSTTGNENTFVSGIFNFITSLF